MTRQVLRATAALGVLSCAAGAASAADLHNAALVGGPLNTINEPRDGAGPYPATGARPPSAMFPVDPSDFDDVRALEFDVARVVGAWGMEVDRSEAALMGRVALRVVADPTVGGPVDVTDPYDPALRQLDQARPTAPVNVYDVGAEANALTPRRGVRLDYSTPVSSSFAGVEVALEPRANVVMGSDVSGVGGGAIVRFGRNLTAPREDRSRWYAFVGADAQALTWSLGSTGQEPTLRLEDKQLIGDYQAGVAVRVGEGDLAFGLVHREVKHNGASRNEQFVGVSYAIRR